MPLVQTYNFSMADSVRSTFHHSRYRKAIHIHQFAEIVFVLEGSFRVTANGKKSIAKAGDIVIIPPYQPHGFYTETGEEVKIWMMLFSGNLISDISMKNKFQLVSNIIKIFIYIVRTIDRDHSIKTPIHIYKHKHHIVNTYRTL